MVARNEIYSTTIWERWNSVLDNGQICQISGTEMNSLNHYAYGSIANWMYRYMCGFEPTMGEDIKMIIRPMPNPLIQSVSGRWDSPYGEYKVSWYYDDIEKLHFKVKILNETTRILSAGVYHWESPKEYK